MDKKLLKGFIYATLTIILICGIEINIYDNSYNLQIQCDYDSVDVIQ